MHFFKRGERGVMVQRPLLAEKHLDHLVDPEAWFLVVCWLLLLLLLLLF